jgi:hypothetical protein
MTDTPRDAASAGETARDESARNERVPHVLVLVRDLMFSSRIAATARAAAAPITLVRDPSQLASAPDAPRLLLDLNLPGAIDAAIQWKRAAPSREVIGFVSHVDAVTIARARGAGFDQVLPRSRFVEALPDLLA